MPPAPLPSTTPFRHWPRTAGTSCAKTIYGGTSNLLAHTLPAFGVQTTFVNAHDLAEVEAAIQDNTRAVYIETLGNPNADIPDIDAIAAIAHKHSIPLVIDNTFGTPLPDPPDRAWCRHRCPFCHQVHRRPRHLLGGIIVDSGKFDWKASGKFPRPFWSRTPVTTASALPEAAGPAAFVTYVRAVILRDTGRLHQPVQRMPAAAGHRDALPAPDRHIENTKKVVEFLTHHPKVEKVNHPSLPDHPDHAPV